jgi:hypothetical protein
MHRIEKKGDVTLTFVTNTINTLQFLLKCIDVITVRLNIILTSTLGSTIVHTIFSPQYVIGSRCWQSHIGFITFPSGVICLITRLDVRHVNVAVYSIWSAAKPVKEVVRKLLPFGWCCTVTAQILVTFLHDTLDYIQCLCVIHFVYLMVYIFDLFYHTDDWPLYIYVW